MGYYSYKYTTVLQCIKYIENNGDHDLAEYPKLWDNRDFDNWQVQRYLKRRSRDLMACTTPVVISKGMVLNEEEITPEMHAKIISNKELVSNLIVVDAVDDDINNAKLSLGCKNLI